MSKPVFLFILVMSCVSGCGKKSPTERIPEPAAVKVTDAVIKEISIPVHCNGILSASEEIRLSFKTGGIIENIPVREGEGVSKGQLLAQLDPAEINAHYSQAASGYEKSLRDYNRAKNLYADSVITLEVMQNAQTGLNLAKSSLDIALFNKAHSEIRAPEKGIILKQLAKTDELVAPGYPVLLFGSRGKHWKVKAGLADKDIVKINAGDSASVSFDTWPGVYFPAFVELTGEMANPLTGTYESELLLSDLGYRLASGFVAEVEIFPAGKEKLLMVPLESLVEAEGNSAQIFTVTDSMTVKKIQVEILAIRGTNAAIKDSGISKKKIVREGCAYIKDGDRIRIIE